MIKFFRGLLVIVCCMAGMAVAEEKNILVTSGSDRATPIAVVPFGWQGGTVLPDDIAEIVGNDLRNSGYYSPTITYCAPSAFQSRKMTSLAWVGWLIMFCFGIGE